MKEFLQRTDLAIESRELARGSSASEIEGVKYETQELYGNICHLLDVTTQNGAQELGKPVGKYFTLEFDGLVRRESEAFAGCTSALSELILKLLDGVPNALERVLVVGLGNRDITPDAIGPISVESVLVTRHLKQHMPEDFAAFSPVSVITPGVLGTSGIESADYIKMVCAGLMPSCVLVIDALAARSSNRLCRTVQLTNTGITPGSGVGNNRASIDADFLGAPVIAIGVPTVIDVRTLLADCEASDRPDAVSNGMFVTPRTIDSDVACVSRLIGYSIDMALHKGISVEDIDMLVG